MDFGKTDYEVSVSCDVGLVELYKNSKDKLLEM